MGWPFCKMFWSSWNVHVTQERNLIGFAVRKFRRNWNIWTSNANRAKDIFRPVLFFSPICACPMRKISLATSEKREWKSGFIRSGYFKICGILVISARTETKLVLMLIFKFRVWNFLGLAVRKLLKVGNVKVQKPQLNEFLVIAPFFLFTIACTKGNCTSANAINHSCCCWWNNSTRYVLNIKTRRTSTNTEYYQQCGENTRPWWTADAGCLRSSSCKYIMWGFFTM